MNLSTEAPPALHPAESQAQREAAFSAMVDRQARFLYRVAFSLLKNHQDAEDAASNTLQTKVPPRQTQPRLRHTHRIGKQDRLLVRTPKRPLSSW